MVAIKKHSVAKNQKTRRGGHLMTYYTKKREKGGHFDHHVLHKVLMRQTARFQLTFSTLYFAAVSLRIHVEFLNDERGKEKDR